LPIKKKRISYDSLTPISVCTNRFWSWWDNTNRTHGN